MNINWPDTVTIVDDSTNGESLQEWLHDLSWMIRPEDFVFKFAEHTTLEDVRKLLLILTPQVRLLAEEEPTYFAEKIADEHRASFIHLDGESKVVLALQRLRQGKNTLAFLDFDYKMAGSLALTLIDEEYQKCPKSWQLASQTGSNGGFVFSHAFAPSPIEESNTRLLVPASFVTSTQLKRLHPTLAIMDNYPLHGSALNRLSAVVDTLNEWVKIKMKLLCPLDQIWEVAHTHNWFASNLPATQLPTIEDMTHDLPNFNLLSASMIEEWCAAYRKVFESIFEIQLSEQWWKNPAFLNTIHETLKHICGADYCGNTSGGSKYNLTVGAAYLIAILAMQNGTGDASMLTSNLELNNVRAGLTTRLFPLQGVEDARRGARALYFLFRFLFTPNPKHGDGKPTCCTSFNFLDAGHTMAFGLSWPSGSRESLADEVAEKLPRAMQEDSSPNRHLVDAIQELNASMLHSSKGFGSPGTIWLESSSDRKNHNDPAEENRAKKRASFSNSILHVSGKW